MTPPGNHDDDRDLEEFLGHRSELSRRYQSSASEEPPPELDRAVLARARAAVEDTSPDVSRLPVRRTRWMVPFAVAATVLLSFVIFRDAGVGTGVMPQESAAPVSAPANANFLDEERESKTAAEVQEPVTVTLNSAAADRVSPPPPPAPAIEPPDVPAPVAPPEAVVNQPAPAPPASTSSIGAFAGPRATIPNQARAEVARARSAETRDASEERKESRTPEVWLEDIRKLRAADKAAEADAELLLFLVAHPDYFDKNPGTARP